MIIRSVDENFEVIQKLQSGKNTVHYLCRIEGETDGKTWHLIQFPDKEEIGKVIALVMDMQENGAFTDFKEYFLDQNVLTLVFRYEAGISLLKFLEQDGIGFDQRYVVGKSVLERILLLSLPVYLQWVVLTPENIIISKNEEINTSFYYDLEDAADSRSVTAETAGKRLETVFHQLFSPEEASGLYPEIGAFFKALGGLYTADMLSLYEEYLLLFPLVSEERAVKPEKTENKEKAEKKKWKISKKAVLIIIKILAAAGILAAAVAVGPVVWERWIFPFAEARYLVKTMGTEDSLVSDYSGRVKLLAPDSSLVFKGQLEKGKMEGEGTVYYESGEIEYEGGFHTGLYEGQGSLYDKAGRVVYRGGFSLGLYEGEGILFYDNGSIAYQGSFQRGQKSGEGSQYDTGGDLMYRGGFQNNRYEGEGVRYRKKTVVETGTFTAGTLTIGTGILYDKEGVVCYEGELKNEVQDGAGTAYEHGILSYEGEFSGGRYEGKGKLYSPNTGGLLYEGEFANGKYEGEGTLYEPVSNFLVYQGNFRMGKYDGKGMEYDANGNLMYEGEFRLGVWNGAGISYESAAGKVLQEGIFRDGVLVTAAEEIAKKQEEPGAGGETEPAGEDAKTIAQEQAEGPATEAGNPGPAAETGQQEEKAATEMVTETQAEAAAAEATAAETEAAKAESGPGEQSSQEPEENGTVE